MKVTRLAIQGKDYISLKPFDQEFTYIPRKKNIIEPICLVGENGSGKSNLLELVAEIFFKVESDIRKVQRERGKPKFTVDRSFLIEYIIYDKNDQEILIRIDSFESKQWRISKKDGDDFVEIPKNEIKTIKSLLPVHIIAYSSGENESLSYWFSELDKEYSDEVQRAANEQSDERVDDTRMVYMDYDINSVIVVSNYLYNELTTLNVFKNNIRIAGVESFRVYMDFRIGSGKNKYVRLSKEHLDYINRFKACATAYNIEEDDVWFVNKTLKQPVKCIFDFYVTQETRKAIKAEGHFNSVTELFMAFRKFDLLNSLKLKGSYRKSTKKKDILRRPPSVGFEDRIFRIEDINLKINNPDKTIPYIGISDGEHQFFQTIGTILLFKQRNVLFLLDEPETHYNPQWRRKFVSILNSETKDRYQEVILTTHSPFIVSDCRGYNVFLFKREDEQVSFNQFGSETFGTSVDTILKIAFNMEESISELAEEQIEEVLEETDFQIAKKKVEEMGPSFEKMEALMHVKKLEKDKEE